MGVGDLFIFFGWFKRTIKVNGKLAFDRTDVIERPPNRVYVASESGLKAGVFSTESESVVLTKEGGGLRSQWLLDEAFESLFLERDFVVSR